MSDPHTYTIRPLSQDEIGRIVSALYDRAKIASRLQEADDSYALANELLSAMEATDTASALGTPTAREQGR